jgi:hypothetical protein
VIGRAARLARGGTTTRTAGGVRGATAA